VTRARSKNRVTIDRRTRTPVGRTRHAVGEGVPKIEEGVQKENVDAPAEIRIEPPKVFASLSKEDDGPDQKVEWTTDREVWSSDCVAGRLRTSAGPATTSAGRTRT
jgi:hypothetical protein